MSFYVGTPEVSAGEWLDPDLDQNEYREFLEAARNRARGIIPEPEFVQEVLDFDSEVIDEDKAK